MKKEFIGFYDPKKEEIDQSWDKGYFVFDTNTLLNLYRYTEETRKDFITVLEKIKDKLFLPYQVAFEFHTNRLNVIRSLSKSFEQITDKIEANFEKTIKPELQSFKRHPSILVDNIITMYGDFIKNLTKELDKQKEGHPDFIKNDEILSSLTSLFENKLGKEFSREELKKIYVEGKDRYEQQIPPGYKDVDKKKGKGERNLYGDYIIWKELIYLIKKEKRPLIYVTDDRKEDWWTSENGETIRPREELIKEFFDLTNVRILIYNADSFLHFSKERGLVPKINEKTIAEVKEVRQSDLSSYNIEKHLLSIYEMQNSPQVKDLVKLVKGLRTGMVQLPKLEIPINQDILDLIRRNQDIFSEESSYKYIMETPALRDQPTAFNENNKNTITDSELNCNRHYLIGQ